MLEFIVDFMCTELKLVIEVDGITHTWQETVEKDKRKEEHLKKAGFHVLRFGDEEILKRLKATPIPPPAGDNLSEEVGSQN